MCIKINGKTYGVERWLSGNRALVADIYGRLRIVDVPASALASPHCHA